MIVSKIQLIPSLTGTFTCAYIYLCSFLCPSVLHCRLIVVQPIARYAGRLQRKYHRKMESIGTRQYNLNISDCRSNDMSCLDLVILFRAEDVLFCVYNGLLKEYNTHPLNFMWYYIIADSTIELYVFVEQTIYYHRLTCFLIFLILCKVHDQFFTFVTDLSPFLFNGFSLLHLTF